MAVSLVAGAPSDGWNFSAHRSETLGSSMAEDMVMAFLRSPVSRASAVFTVTIAMIRSDRVHYLSAWDWLLSQPAACRGAGQRNGCCANQMQRQRGCRLIFANGGVVACEGQLLKFVQYNHRQTGDAAEGAVVGNEQGAAFLDARCRMQCVRRAQVQGQRVFRRRLPRARAWSAPTVPRWS